MGTRQSRSILGHRAAFALLAALACALGALVLPVLAGAAVPFDSFVVNSAGNGNKIAAGNVCESAPGKCTLRAALEAADANVGLSEITFGGPFDGTEATAIDLEGTALPAIETPIDVKGSSCGPAPCVRLRNPSSSNPVLAFTSTESEVSELTIVRGGSGTGVRLGGSKNTLRGTEILNPYVGVEVTGNEGLLVDNTIKESSHSGFAGIAIRGSSNQVFGNLIENLSIQAIALELGADANRIGGDTPASENVIDNTEQRPIVLASNLSAASHNEVARNRGAGNGGSFILRLSGNEGLGTPTITTAFPTTVSGTAEPGALVRVFATGAVTSDIDGFLGEATADPSTGNWTATVAPAPVGGNVVATQTLAGGTSEFTEATPVVAEPVEPGGGGGGSGGGGEPGGGSGAGNGSSSGGSSSNNSSPQPAPVTTVAPPPPTPPTVTITKGPKKSSRSTTAKFTFKATSSAGARFQCRLDGRKWATCKAPKTYPRLKPGRHLFQVRASASGLTGLAAKFKFTVKP